MRYFRKAKIPPRMIMSDKEKELTHAYELLRLDSKHPLEKAPAYSFQIGDKAGIGALQDVTILGYNEDKTIYEISYTGGPKKDGNVHYTVACWWELRPLLDKNKMPERIAVSGVADIVYNNSTISSLLSRYYHNGIDLNPAYQRDFIWDETDKEYLLDSIFHDGIEIGRFVLVSLSNEDYKKRDYSYEILDGKQRLSTLIEFYENRIPYKGLYFNEMHPLDKRQFLNKHIAIGEVSDLTYEETLKLFLAVNRGGRAMDNDHLQTIENELADIQQKEENDYER